MTIYRWLLRLLLVTLVYYLWVHLILFKLYGDADEAAFTMEEGTAQSDDIPYQRNFDPTMFQVPRTESPNDIPLNLADAFDLRYNIPGPVRRGHFYYYSDLPSDHRTTRLFYPNGCSGNPCIGSDEDAVVEPTFMILGGQKCGTTSLFNYLLEHPQILPLNQHSKAMGGKEIRFFDRRPDIYTGNKTQYIEDNFIRWKDLQNYGRRDLSQRYMTGESTPNYLRYPDSPTRIRQMFPNMKFIVLLRDPIDRAFSQYNHALKIDFQQRYTGGHSYEAFLRAENLMLYHCSRQQNVSDWNSLCQCVMGLRKQAATKFGLPSIASIKGRLIWLFQTLDRGFYSRLLDAYASEFPDPRQFFIVQSEEFYREPVKVMERIEWFLGLEPFDWSLVAGAEKNIFNFGHGNRIEASSQSQTYEPMDPELRRQLKRIFAPLNRELYEIFQRPDSFPRWDGQ